MDLETRNFSKYKTIILIISYIIIIFISWYFLSTYFLDQEKIRTIINSFGIFGPILFILLQITQNVIAPIAHYPILLAGGFIWGHYIGFVLNWIGTILGTYLIIILTKKYGRPIVNKMVSKKIIEKYDWIFKKISPYGLFLIYALPVFPDDEITYLIGLSNMPKKNIFWAIILGKIPGAALSFTGNNALTGAIPTLIIQIIVLILGTIIYYRIEISNFIKKILKKLSLSI